MNHDRFFLDHGAIHDRLTGKHVGMQAEIDWQPRLLSLLNDMWEQIAENTVNEDAILPEGYLMVPREPTDRMLACGQIQRDSAQSSTAQIYRAMISASPLNDRPNLHHVPPGMRFCAIHNTFYGYQTDTIPITKCPLCSIAI